MGKGLAEHEKTVLRSAQESITEEIGRVLDILHRLEDSEDSLAVVIESLRYCRRHLVDARLSLDDALTHSRNYLEE